MVVIENILMVQLSFFSVSSQIKSINKKYFQRHLIHAQQEKEHLVQGFLTSQV